MGAWIETCCVRISYKVKHVAPRVGAWIETGMDFKREEKQKVAPRVGAWIETCFLGVRLYTHSCRPSRGGVD